VVNFFGAWFFLKSMSIFQASVLFPVINVSVVVLSTFAGMIFFKEKLRAINIIGLTVALIAILMITSA
jgi:multidrug transporter EmrE-like cation transporter